ncbi:MAG: hypothetical protein ACOC9Z_01980 [Chloroflexota bacterium]
MTNFDWRTDEEQGWDRPQAVDPRPPADESAWRTVRRRARSSWRIVLGLVFFLAATTTVGVRALALRVQAAEDAVREEVHAAHGLVYDAARNGDEELFVSMLGGDRSWRQAQESAFLQHTLLGRSTMGLEWQLDVEPVTEIKLSPDLQQALVTGTVPYKGYVGGDGLQPVMLQHVWRYENDGTQWRLAPHAEDFWRGWVTVDSEHLQTVMPRRDEALVEQLNEDIGAQIGPICDVLGRCPQPFRLHLRFEQNSETLHTPSTWITAPRDRLTLALPAPSLLGMPVDETAYRALVNGYLRIIVNELLNSFVLRDPASSDPFREALHREIAAELDLAKWPPAPNEQDFGGQLETESDILALCVGQGAEDASLLRYDTTAATWDTAFEGRDVTRMLGLDGVPGVLLQARKPQGTEIHPHVVWWRDGQDAARFEELYLGDTVSGSPTFIAGEQNGQAYWIWLGGATECDGRACSGVVMRPEQTVWSPDGSRTLFMRELEGSRSPPAGDEVLWLGDGSGVALQRLGDGSYPFWVDNGTFGFLTARPERELSFPFSYDLVLHELETEQVSDPDIRPLHIVEALRETAPQNEEGQEMGVAITGVAVHPVRPQMLYVSAVRFTGRPSQESSPEYTLYLLAVDIESGEISPRIASLHRQFSYAMRFSPDGRWLAHVTLDPEIQEGVLAVTDLTQDPPARNVWERPLFSRVIVGFGMRDITPAYDWSQGDGRLLMMDGGVLTILDPQTGREQQLVPPTPGCAYAAWAD